MSKSGMRMTPKTTGTKRINKTQRLAWPEAARQAYGEIVRLHKLLTADITISIERGTQKRNKFVVAEFAPYIKEGAREIMACCQQICDLWPKKRGRYPKWYTDTEEIQMIVAEILNLAEKLGPAIEENKLISLQGYCEGLHEESLSLGAILRDNPYRSELDPWVEVVDFVKEAFEAS